MIVKYILNGLILLFLSFKKCKWRKCHITYSILLLLVSGKTYIKPFDLKEGSFVMYSEEYLFKMEETCFGICLFRLIKG